MPRSDVQRSDVFMLPRSDVQRSDVFMLYECHAVMCSAVVLYQPGYVLALLYIYAVHVLCATYIRSALNDTYAGIKQRRDTRMMTVMICHMDD